MSPGRVDCHRVRQRVPAGLAHLNDHSVPWAYGETTVDADSNTEEDISELRKERRLSHAHSDCRR